MEILPNQELGPPSPEFWDDKTHVLFALDGAMLPSLAATQRKLRAEIQEELGLPNAEHVDVYCPELWQLPSKEYWSVYLDNFVGEGLQAEELMDLEKEASWYQGSTIPPLELKPYAQLWIDLYHEGIHQTLVSDMEDDRAYALLDALREHVDNENYSHFTRPDTSLPNEVGGNSYSTKGEALSLDNIEKFLQTVPSRTVVIVDNIPMLELAKARGYTVIAVGEVLNDAAHQHQADYFVVDPSEIVINKLPDEYEDYDAPALPDLKKADGTTEFWVKAFWNQVEREPKAPRGWEEQDLRRLGFDEPVVRSSVVTAIQTQAVAKYDIALPPIDLVLFAYDGTPYEGHEHLFVHETLISKFEELFETHQLDSHNNEASIGTHLYEDRSGRVFLSVIHVGALNNAVEGETIGYGSEEKASEKLVDFMRAYGIDYIINKGKYGGSMAYLIDKEGTVKNVDTLSDEERQRRMIDNMVQNAARQNGFSPILHPALYQMYEKELWRHWDNGLAINVYELAKSLSDLVSEESAKYEDDD